MNTCSVGTLCQRNVVCISSVATVLAAAELIRSAHVGCLLVTEAIAGGGGSRVVGTLTDRDIVVSVVARNVDPTELTVGDVMSHHPLMVADSASLETALALMEQAGVRRLVVTGAKDELLGILSCDDVLQAVSQQMTMICGAFRNEVKTERLVRP